jgi:hypothetical protein
VRPVPGFSADGKPGRKLDRPGRAHPFLSLIGAEWKAAKVITEPHSCKEKGNRRKEYMTVFVNGKQKRVKRPDKIDAMEIDEFVRRNADSIWLHQNEKGTR